VATVYRGVYLERARSVLGRYAVPRLLEKAGRDLVSIARPLERADRPRVKQLAARTQALRDSVEGNTGRDVESSARYPLQGSLVDEVLGAGREVQRRDHEVANPKPVPVKV